MSKRRDQPRGMLYQCHQGGCYHKGTRQLSNLKEHIFLKHLRPRIVATFPETHELARVKSLRELENSKKYAVEEIIEEHYIVGGRLKSRLEKHRGDPEFKQQLADTLNLPSAMEMTDSKPSIIKQEHQQLWGASSLGLQPLMNPSIGGGYGQQMIGGQHYHSSSGFPVYTPSWGCSDQQASGWRPQVKMEQQATSNVGQNALVPMTAGSSTLQTPPSATVFPSPPPLEAALGGTSHNPLTFEWKVDADPYHPLSRPPTPPMMFSSGLKSAFSQENLFAITQDHPSEGVIITHPEACASEGYDDDMSQSTISMAPSDHTVASSSEGMSFFAGKRKRLRSPASAMHTQDVDPDVMAFLESISLEGYVSLFAREKFDYSTLLTVSNQELLEVGVSAMGHRKKILNAIHRIRITDYTRCYDTLTDNTDDTDVVDLCSISSYVSSTLTDEPDVHTFDGMRLSVVKQKLTHFDRRYGEKYGLRTRALNLSHNKLNSITNLGGFEGLKELFLDHNFLDAREGSLDFPYLGGLRTLVVQNNHIPRDNLPRFLDVVARRFPNLVHLVLLKNPCCPSPYDHEEEEYHSYRMQVINALPKLRFLDSSEVDDQEREVAATAGAAAMMGTQTPFGKGMEFIRKNLLTP